MKNNYQTIDQNKNCSIFAIPKPNGLDSLNGSFV